LHPYQCIPASNITEVVTMLARYGHCTSQQWK
jgi:hypothetical protein